MLRWILQDDGLEAITVRSFGNRWYWFGCGRNTFDTPCDTVEEAVAQVMVFYRELVAE